MNAADATAQRRRLRRSGEMGCNLPLLLLPGLPAIVDLTHRVGWVGGDWLFVKLLVAGRLAYACVRGHGTSHTALHTT